MADVVIGGVRLPFLLAVLIGSGVLHLIFDRLFARVGIYARVWHPGLFRVAVFFCLFASAGLLFYP